MKRAELPFDLPFFTSKKNKSQSGQAQVEKVPTPEETKAQLLAKEATETEAAEQAPTDDNVGAKDCVNKDSVTAAEARALKQGTIYSRLALILSITSYFLFFFTCGCLSCLGSIGFILTTVLPILCSILSVVFACKAIGKLHSKKDPGMAIIALGFGVRAIQFNILLFILSILVVVFHINITLIVSFLISQGIIAINIPI